MSKDLFFNYIKELSSSIEYTPCFDFKRIKSKISKSKLYRGCKFGYNSFLDFDKLEKNREIIISNLRNKFVTLESFEFDSGDKLFDQHLIMFKERLLMWQRYLTHFNLKGYLTPYDILLRSLREGPAFADSLKNTFDYSLRCSVGIEFIYMEDFDVIKDMEDINQIYPPNRLLNWKRDFNLDDMKNFCFKKPKISNKNYNNLRIIMKKYMKKNIPLFHKDLFDDIELSNEKSSFKGKTFTDRVNTGFDIPVFNNNRLNFRISSIHKSPCESRVIAIADSNSRNLIYTVRKNYKEILNCPYDVYGSKPWQVYTKLNENYKKVFFMFDQKKCGWTFPMELMELFFECLSSLYPNFDEFRQMQEIFKNKNIFYYFENEEMKPQRGFTLGMFDDAVSFIMACIFEEFKEKLKEHSLILNDDIIEGLFFGDDCIIIYNDDNDCDWRSISAQWMVYLDCLGISINSKKSFKSLSGIFCEMYGANSNFHNFKNIQYLSGVYDVLLCYNTAHAKYIMNSYKKSYDEYLKWIPPSRKVYLIDLINQSINDIINSFPIEFNEKEYDLPYEIGGWFSNYGKRGNTFLSEVFQGKWKPFLKLHMTKFPTDIIHFCSDKKLKKIYQNFYNNAGVSKIKNNLAYFELENMLKLDQKINNFILKSDPKTECKIWWEYQKRRVLNYQKPSNLLLCEEREIFAKNFINSEITLDMVERIEDTNFLYLDRLPKALHASCKYRIPPHKAICLLYQMEGIEDPFNVSISGHISLNDLLMSIDYDISSSNHLIPTQWWELSKSFNTSIKDIKAKLWYCGIDPMIYIPSFFKRERIKENIVLPIIKRVNEYIYYEPYIGKYINCNNCDLHFLQLLEDEINYSYKFFLTLSLGEHISYYDDKHDLIRSYDYDINSPEDQEDQNDEVSKEIMKFFSDINPINFQKENKQEIEEEQKEFVPDPFLGFSEEEYNRMWADEGEPFSDDENYKPSKKKKKFIILGIDDQPFWEDDLDNIDGGNFSEESSSISDAESVCSLGSGSSIGSENLSDSKSQINDE